ncbi:MAG: BON domain-containing protein [Proteobacteria bacterium]|nr:BON domain-containing protein [Pseudomonadota bacterium]
MPAVSATRRGDPRARVLLALSLGVVAGGCALTGRCGLHECADEAALHRAVEQRLGQYPELRPPNEVYVQVRDHTVTLSGQVGSDYSRRLAESVAGETPQVGRVVNFIAVTNNPR